MNNKFYRDDSYLNRLASFLNNEGDLNVSLIRRIKDHVYFLQTTNEAFVLKAKRSEKTLLQQWEFFNASNVFSYNTVKKFPNGKPMLYGFGFYWVIIPYIAGDTLDFSNPDDRKEAVASLQQFHRQAAGLKIANPIIKHPLYIKCFQRLNLLFHMQHLIKNLGFGDFYEELLNTTKERLIAFEKLDWHKVEKDAVDQWQWIHGDVASHNYLKDATGMVQLIDFDLLSLSPQIYDHIQLGQRFLPFMDWNLERLITYWHWENAETFKFWLLGLTVPSDFIREITYYTRRNRPKEQLLPFFRNCIDEWSNRKQLIQQADEVIKNLSESSD